MNKYRNKKVQVDMYVFDSIAESRRYKELKLLRLVHYCYYNGVDEPSVYELEEI